MAATQMRSDAESAVSIPPPKAVRSPSYPSTSLGDSVAQVRKIEASYRLSPVDRAAAAKMIGYSGLSGPANHTLAALAHYGLVERAGKGEMRVTSLARTILHPNSEDEKRNALRAAAFEPQLFQELHDRWPDMVPPEDGVITYLNRQGFNQSAIKPAARAYLQTLAYLRDAGVGESDSHGAEPTRGAESSSSDMGDGEQKPVPVYGGARVGDCIQWEADGALQFGIPARVRWVSEDDRWVAVEGSDTGIPMSEDIVHERVGSPPIPPAQPPRVPQAGLNVAAGVVLRTTVFNLPEGDVSLTYPAILSDDSVDLLKYQIEGTFKALVLAKKAAQILYPNDAS
jgi:hypothetical protein